MSYTDELERADQVMCSGRLDEAKQLLLAVISKSGYRRGICADAVAIFLSGCLFSDARDVVQKYLTVDGSSLRGFGGSDFSLDDIAELESRLGPIPTTGDGGLVFEAYPILSFRDGSVGLNLWAHLHGIAKLVVFPDHLETTYRSNVLTFRWSELAASVVTKRSGGRGSFVNHVTLRVLDDELRSSEHDKEATRSSKRVLRFKTIPSAPQYFHHEPQLLPELRKHLLFER